MYQTLKLSCSLISEFASALKILSDKQTHTHIHAETNTHFAFTLAALIYSYSLLMHQTFALCFLSSCCLFVFFQQVQRWDGQLWPLFLKRFSLKQEGAEGLQKRQNPLGRSFLLPVCVHLSPRSPRLPLGASQHLFYWPLLCVREQIGFYSQVRVEDKCECSITFCIRLELSGCEQVCPSRPTLAQGCVCESRVCIFV